MAVGCHELLKEGAGNYASQAECKSREILNGTSEEGRKHGGGRRTGVETAEGRNENEIGYARSGT
jgi:hypothetical protein